MQASTANLLLISEQISRVRRNYPHSVALSCVDRTLSYEELDRRANQFAGHLAHRGIVSGGTVAICVERSFDWIVGALGIMRAGAAYVPLDSAWPDSRLRFAVKDSVLRTNSLELRGRFLSAVQVASSHGNGTTGEDGNTIFFRVSLDVGRLAEFRSHDPAHAANNSNGNAAAFDPSVNGNSWQAFYSHQNEDAGFEWQLRLRDLTRKSEWERWKILECAAVPVATRD